MVFSQVTALREARPAGNLHRYPTLRTDSPRLCTGHPQVCRTGSPVTQGLKIAYEFRQVALPGALPAAATPCGYLADIAEPDVRNVQDHAARDWLLAAMELRAALVELVVSDMAATLAFYRRLGLDLPDGAEREPHVDAALGGGLRIAWDTEDTIHSFDPGWSAPAGDGHRVALAFACASPAEVDAAPEPRHDVLVNPVRIVLPRRELDDVLGEPCVLNVCLEPLTSAARIVGPTFLHLELDTVPGLVGVLFGGDSVVCPLVLPSSGADGWHWKSFNGTHT
jgi:catechol 2,3-dioxygenase-like lactoylglutathione lyase family enzyme